MLHDGVDADDPELDALRAAGVDVVDGRVRRIVTGDDGHVAAVELADGDRIDADAVVVGPRFRVRAEPFASLGLEPAAHPTGLGDVVETDATGATAVPGLYAAGNVTDPSQQVLQAAADGSRVGGMISFSLADDDIEAAARPSANEADWDHRYGGDQMWSGNPNGTLVNEIGGLAPGRALDVGAGEGGDALWLAEQGWSVTASDISQRALDRVAAEAERRGLRVECHHADANALDAFEPGAFDLVSAQYASIPRTPDGRGVRNLLDAVAPGGTLLVVSHDLEPMRAPIDTPTAQPAVRPRRLRAGRRLRGGARRLVGLGHRGPREATPPGRGRLRLAPRRRRRAARPPPRQLTRSTAAVPYGLALVASAGSARRHWDRSLRFLNLRLEVVAVHEAMKSIEISFGHAASHSPWFVHEPKNSSIVSTIASVRC